MPSLTIRHVTTYRYRQPVAFGEHRMMLRPRDSHDQRVIEAHLRISPEPKSLRFVRDAYGNHVGIAQFSSRSEVLCFESTARVEHSSLDLGQYLDDAEGTFPGAYCDDEVPDLVACIGRHYADPGNEIDHWVRQFLPATGTIGAFEFLARLSLGINRGFLYRRRETKGIQHPLETLRLGHGSCRDFAVLMIEAVRSFGLAARFASGYLAIPLDDPSESVAGSARGSTHAWAQVYLSGAGWVDFDPTNGSAGSTGLVTVAVVRDPDHAIPLHGTFIGYPSDHLGMDVEVQVISDAPVPAVAIPQRARRSRSPRLV